ncbi:MAG: serine/threonine protein kinase, partial [Deltaproteobacteria bacterium]|nr:serine/threonine protein kinase [Deltaproteobacteria bacterium]
MESEAGSRGSSSTWRLTSGATGRLTESLLSSGGAVAAVGSVTALLTLGFAISLGLELRYQSGTAVPLARTATVMNNSLNHSLAALHGWVAFGLSELREERSRIWTGQIEPTRALLEQLARKSGDAPTIQSVAELREVLRELKLVQWAIEDVAQTPGNQPAQVAYDRILSPLRLIVLKSFGSAIDQYSASSQGKRAVDFIALLARFRSSFTQADLALSTHLVDFSGAGEHAARQHLEHAREQASQIQSAATGMVEGDVSQILEFGLEEFGAYELEAQKVLTLRKSAASNVAQLLFIDEAKPLVLRARALSGELTETRVRAMAESFGSLTRGSYLVIGMALMLGLLSGGSLLVSFRLRQQVHNVLEKAKVLGQYEIERLIGKGGMGSVYLAHHAMLRRPTAIKLLRSKNAQDLRAQKRFQREVQLTCQLTHPNTIEIFDYGRTPEGIFYYAMEYVDGFTLASLVSLAGPVDPSRVIHTLVQACGSLHEAHEQGLLHRDIKPLNIMLTQRGGVYDCVKILDFGLVKDLAGD